MPSAVSRVDELPCCKYSFRDVLLRSSRAAFWRLKHQSNQRRFERWGDAVGGDDHPTQKVRMKGRIAHLESTCKLEHTYSGGAPYTAASTYHITLIPAILTSLPQHMSGAGGWFEKRICLRSRLGLKGVSSRSRRVSVVFGTPVCCEAEWSEPSEA